jgi:hypothetical protein
VSERLYEKVENIDQLEHEEIRAMFATVELARLATGMQSIFLAAADDVASQVSGLDQERAAELLRLLEGYRDLLEEKVRELFSGLHALASSESEDPEQGEAV